MKRRELFLQLICALLMMLWVYTALSKWVDIGMFRLQLNQQPLPEWSKEPLVWLLPAGELVVAALLMFGRCYYRFKYWYFFSESRSGATT